MLPFGLTPDAGGFRLLCLGAHPDDIEIGCGGTVLRLLEEVPGIAVRWVVWSGNERRRAEALASARHFLGAHADVTVHHFRDAFFPADFTAIKTAFETLRASFAPTLVLTHYRQDLHQDHRLIAELTYNSFRDHLIWEYEIPKYDGDLGNPNLFAPLTHETLRRKAAAIVEHFPSQRDHPWFSEDSFTALARLRGIGCNAPSGFAEAFYCRKAVI